MRLDLLAAINEERRARRAAVLVTRIDEGAQQLVRVHEISDHHLADVLAERLRTGKSGAVEQDGVRYFLTVQEPPVRLVLVGAVHVSQALAAMARVAGLDVTVIDPRTAFATAERFPDVALKTQWPEEALAAMPIDRFTALAALTHDPKIDDPGLEAALRSPSFYIGALGSRKTHGARRQRLLQRGFAESDLARIRAPIGLDIGAVSPAEIAVSILGEVVANLRRKPTRAETTGKAAA